MKLSKYFFLYVGVSLSSVFFLLSCQDKKEASNQSNHRVKIANTYQNPHILKKLPHSNTFESVDSILNAAITDELIPGAVVMITQQDKIIYKKALGHAQLYAFGKQSMKTPSIMTAEHRFDLASLTKVFATTFAIMLLVDDELINLDAPVHHYLSAFRGSSKDSIVVRDLLSHSAGIYPWKPIYYHATTAQEAHDYICDLPLVYPVGQARHYSDLGFMLLGYMVKKVSGLPLDQFLEKRLYHPLQLNNTAFNPSKDGPPFAVTSHGNPFEKRMVSDDDFGYLCDEVPETFQEWRNYVLDGEVNDGNSYYANEGIAGHAGLFSTASELQVLISLLLNKGMHNSKRILSEEVIATFLTKNSFGHGLGWAMSPRAVPVDNLPTGAFGHTGFTGTFVVVIPSQDLSIIILTNRQNNDVNDSGKYNSLSTLRKTISEKIIETYRLD